MMNRSKKMTVLLCVLVVVCAATLWLTQYEQEQERIRTSDEVILQIVPEDVQTFSWSYGEEELAFHRDEWGTWRWDEDDAFPVDEAVLADYLELFREFGATFAIEEVSDYGPYGLDDPECTIQFATAEEDHTVTLGGFSRMDSQRYVSIGDGNAYLVGTDPLEDFQVTIRDMIDNDEVPAFDQATEIRFSGLADYTVQYEQDSGKSYCPEDVYFTDGRPLDTDRTEDYLSKLSGLSLTNYATYNATQEELASFGMADPELTVSVDYTTTDEGGAEINGTFSLHVSRDPEAVAKAEAAAEEPAEETIEVPTETEAAGEEDPIPCYVRIGESPIVYEIEESQYDSLTAATYDDLRHQDLLPADFGDITQVDITLEGAAYTLTTHAGGENAEETEAEADGETIWYYQDGQLDITSFKSAVTNLIADAFTGEAPTGKEEIAVTFHLNNENFPLVKIQLYRYDGDSCLAVVDGEPTALIGRVYAVNLIEAVNAIVLN